MLIKKLLMFACAVTPIAMAIGGGGYLVRRSQAQAQKPSTVASNFRKRPTKVVTGKLDDIDRLARRLLAAARQRYDAQRAYYEEGRITIDRFVDASKQLALAELRLAKTDADRLTIRQRHLDRIKQILNREQAELQVGRGTVADVAEACRTVFGSRAGPEAQPARSRRDGCSRPATERSRAQSRPTPERAGGKMIPINSPAACESPSCPACPRRSWATMRRTGCPRAWATAIMRTWCRSNR